MAENIRETPLPELNQYNKDDLAILFQHMIDNPPKYQKKKWKLGDYTLSIRFNDSLENQENTNQSINHNLPVTADSNQYVFLELKDTKRKGKVVRARIEAAGVLACFVINQERLSSRTIFPNLLPPFQPGEIDKPQQWCYDINPDKTEASEVPGAHTMLSYQHLLSDGSENPTPWKLKISNYTLVKGNNAFTKKNSTSLFITFSSRVAQEIREHIEKEFDIHYGYQFDLAEIYQTLHSPFSQNNA